MNKCAPHTCTPAHTHTHTHTRAHTHTHTHSTHTHACTQHAQHTHSTPWNKNGERKEGSANYDNVLELGEQKFPPSRPPPHLHRTIHLPPYKTPP